MRDTVTVVLLLLVLVLPSSQSLPASLVSWLRLDGDVSDTFNSLRATPNRHMSPNFTARPNGGQALEANGSLCYNITGFPLLAENPFNYTVSAWLRFQAPCLTIWCVAFGSWFGAMTKNFIHLGTTSVNDSRIAQPLAAKPTLSDWTGRSTAGEVAGGLSANTWYHVASRRAVLNGNYTVTELYIDGVLVSTGSESVFPLTAPVPRPEIMFLGCAFYLADLIPLHPWLGAMDDILYFGDALTPAEVASLMCFDTLCANCSRTSLATCVACQSGAVLSGGVCMCASGYYLDARAAYCAPCAVNGCANCTASRHVCTQCTAGLLLTAGGACVAQPPPPRPSSPPASPPPPPNGRSTTASKSLVRPVHVIVAVALVVCIGALTVLIACCRRRRRARIAVAPGAPSTAADGVDLDGSSKRVRGAAGDA